MTTANCRLASSANYRLVASSKYRLEIVTLNPQPLSKSSLLSAVQRKARVARKSIRTEKAYLGWITDFLRYHHKISGEWIHPSEMTGKEVGQYVEYLVLERKVAKSTQNQAISALFFCSGRYLGLSRSSLRSLASRHRVKFQS